MNMEWNDLAASSLPSLSGGSQWNSRTGSNKNNKASPGQRSSLHTSDNQLGSLFGRLETGNAAPEQQQPFETLEEMLARQEQELIDKILRKTEEATRQKTERLIEQQLNAAWEREREIWIKEIVGTRTLGGVATSGSSAALLPQATNTPLLTSGPSSTTMPSHELRHFPSTRGPAVDVQAPLDPHIVHGHLRVVQTMLNPSEAVQEFQKLVDPSSGSLVQSGYATAWQLVQQLVQVRASGPIDQGIAALVHFCKQFQMLVVNRVRKASLAGQDISVVGANYRSDLASQCAAFVKLSLGITDSPWPVLYYCLRCGDAVAAQEVWQQQAPQDSSDRLVRRILSAMVQSQRDASCFWEGGLPRLAAIDCRAVADLVESSKHLENTNVHQIGFYTLLSGMAQLPTYENVPGFNTIEDYLTGCLWKALLQANPVDELVELGELIQHYGLGYFGDHESGGWSFALPLLATQQYGKALSHLKKAGAAMGLLQATHLGLVLSSAGIAVRNLSKTDSSEGLATSLLVEYANQLLADPTAGALAALEYLVRIPNKNRARKEVASLIAMTGEINKLAGTLNADGVRQKGAALDRYFSHQDISFLLGEAADILSRESGNRLKTDAAAACFMLAGRYANVLVLLNQLISPPDQPDENRQYWLNETESFHAYYLAQPTHVLEELKREEKLDLVKTSRTLMEMNTFFAYLQQGRYNDAWSIATHLNLLPLSQSDLVTKESQYHSLDALVQKALPAFVGGVMEALHQEHRSLKLVVVGDVQSASVAKQRLRELQEQARLLVSFAGLVGMISDQIENLSRLEALMI